VVSAQEDFAGPADALGRNQDARNFNSSGELPYNTNMARGWESKSVEAQVQDLQEKEFEKPSRNLTAGQLESQRRRQLLMLSRARVQHDLQLAQDPRYREQLNRALADLEAQLAGLGDKV
jgi:hypothetical protein